MLEQFSSGNKTFLVVVIIIIAAIGIGYFVYSGGKISLPTTPTTPETPTSVSPTIPPAGQQQAGSETGKPITNIQGQTTGVKCPADTCLNEVQGSGACPSWTGKSGTYTEQECYDYPDQADNLAACDKQRTIYYKTCGVRQQ